MDKNKVLIIAEAGVNHNGSVDVAKKMIDCAFNAGADFVKFQTFRAKDLVTKYAEQAEYQIRNQGDLQNQYEMLKKLEINEKNHKILIEHSKKCFRRFRTKYSPWEKSAGMATTTTANPLRSPIFRVG